MTITAFPLRTWPTPDGDDGMNPLPKPPTKSLRIGHAPRLPRRERTARLLNRVGVYLLAWAAVGVGCWWLALGDPAGYGFIGLGALACLLLPTSKRRVPRARMAGDSDRHAHHVRSSPRMGGLPDGLAATGTGG